MPSCRFFIVKKKGQSRRCSQKTLESFYFCEKHLSKTSRKKESKKKSKKSKEKKTLAEDSVLFAKYQTHIDLKQKETGKNSDVLLVKTKYQISIGSFDISSHLENDRDYLITPQGQEDLFFDNRLPKIIQIIVSMLEQCAIVVTQKNDAINYIFGAINNDKNNKEKFKLHSNGRDAVFYNSELVAKVEPQANHTGSHTMVNFIHISSGEPITIVSAYLDRGEKNEKLIEIVNNIEENPQIKNVIYATDGNIKHPNLQDGVCPYGYESLKLQSFNRIGEKSVNRVVEFMFEKVDTIMFNPQEFCNIPRPWKQDEFSFHKYNLTRNYNHLNSLRTNEEQKKKLEDLVTDTKTHIQSDIFKNNELHDELYPNQNAPSDHPPVAITLQFGSFECNPTTKCESPSFKKSSDFFTVSA